MLALAAGGQDAKRAAVALLRADPADERAGALLEEAVAAAPDDAEAYYLLSRWALVKRRFERAVEAAERSAELSQDNPAALMQVWTVAGMANDLMNKPEEADAAFRKALIVNRALPEFHAVAAYEYLKVLERDHRDEDAGLVLEVILDRAPNFGPARLSRAKQLAAGGEHGQAAREAELALRQVAGNAAVERDAHYLLARLYWRLGKKDLAELHREWLSTDR